MNHPFAHNGILFNPGWQSVGNNQWQRTYPTLEQGQLAAEIKKVNGGLQGIVYLEKECMQFTPPKQNQDVEAIKSHLDNVFFYLLAEKDCTCKYCLP